DSTPTRTQARSAERKSKSGQTPRGKRLTLLAFRMQMSLWPRFFWRGRLSEFNVFSGDFRPGAHVCNPTLITRDHHFGSPHNRSTVFRSRSANPARAGLRINQLSGSTLANA